MEWKLCVPCLLGLEAPIADELRRLDIKNVAAENGRVCFTGGAREIARANVNLRVGERVLLELGRFEARSFEELFVGTKALPWESLLPRDAAFPVKGYSLNSQLFSVSASLMRSGIRSLSADTASSISKEVKAKP